MLDLIIEAARPASDEWAFEFADLELRFRTLGDYSDLVRLKREATAYAESITKKDPKGLPKALKEIQPKDIETAYWAHMLAETCVTKDADKAGFLKMAKKAGALFGAIVNEWQQHQSRAASEGFEAALESAKNASSGTRSESSS